MKYLNYTSYLDPKTQSINLSKFIQHIHGCNLDQIQFNLTYFPNYMGPHGTWGFATDDKDFWDRVVAGCAYYREIELETA